MQLVGAMELNRALDVRVPLSVMLSSIFQSLTLMNLHTHSHTTHTQVQCHSCHLGNIPNQSVSEASLIHSSVSPQSWRDRVRK